MDIIPVSFFSLGNQLFSDTKPESIIPGASLEVVHFLGYLHLKVNRGQIQDGYPF